MAFRPTQMVPFMKVPVVRTTALAEKFMPKKVSIPSASPLEDSTTRVAMPSRMWRFGVASRTLRISAAYSSLSV